MRVFARRIADETGHIILTQGTWEYLEKLTYLISGPKLVLQNTCCCGLPEIAGS